VWWCSTRCFQGRLLLRPSAEVNEQGPEDAQPAYQAHSLQQRLRWMEVGVRPPPRKQPRCAFLEGFSLHANTHLHANDRQGLERLCRYGARGALALERLSRAEDGRIAYRMKRPLPDGTTHLLFTGLELLRRVASLVPPPRTNLTRLHGAFAPGSKLRPFLVPQAGEEGGSVASQAAVSKEPKKERVPRVDWAELLRRRFALDVFTCAWCGGKPKTPTPLLPPPGACCAQWRCTVSPTSTAHSPRGTRQQPSSTPRFLPSPSTGPIPPIRKAPRFRTSSKASPCWLPCWPALLRWCSAHKGEASRHPSPFFHFRHRGEHVEVERPPEQLSLVHSRRPFLQRLLAGPLH
jgi:hypothetical protein